MSDVVSNPQVVRFGAYEVDLRSGELRKKGRKVKLTGQPFQVLAILLEHAGKLVTREQLQKQLWPSETFVDFDRGLNAAINRVREALGDSAENPRFVETLPRRGYRFITPVDRDSISISSTSEGLPTVPVPGRRILSHLWLLAALALAAALVSGKVLLRSPRPPRVLGFKQLTHDGQQKWWLPLASDGSRIYFNEMLPDQRTLILQVPVKGGEALPLPISLERPTMVDLSRDGSELLVENSIDAEQHSLWVQPVTGGSARRVGTIVALDARFTADGTKIIYTDIGGPEAGRHDV